METSTSPAQAFDDEGRTNIQAKTSRLITTREDE